MDKEKHMYPMIIQGLKELFYRPINWIEIGIAMLIGILLRGIPEYFRTSGRPSYLQFFTGVGIWLVAFGISAAIVRKYTRIAGVPVIVVFLLAGSIFSEALVTIKNQWVDPNFEYVRYRPLSDAEWDAASTAYKFFVPMYFFATLIPITLYRMLTHKRKIE